MIGLPPGNILQYLYIRQRVRKLKKAGKGSFVEVGAGNGYLSGLLLKAGFTGHGVDLNESACENNRTNNAAAIASGAYSVHHGDFFGLDVKADIIISSMVIEHLPEEDLDRYFQHCRSILNPNGVIITLVPASMKYWGIEDEIAGHMKRYEFEDFQQLESRHDLQLRHVSGLTFPLSNVFFGLSNRLVRKGESDKLEMSQKEKTVYTGNRDVAYKTTFPTFLNIILNPVVMYPFHVLQMLFHRNRNSMVIYAELAKV
ncbi:MAG: class I SAM-dependent methyltransferase [Bacteroidota bacterium]